MAAPEKITNDPVVDKVIATIHKKYSKSFCSTTAIIKKIPPIPTGSFGLDLATGIGGFPQGRIIEVFGTEAAAKTSLSLAIAKRAQDIFTDRFVLLIDMEYSFTDDYIDGFGFDRSRLVIVNPDTVEEAFNSMMDLVKTGRFCAVVFDSIDACQTQAELNKQIGEANVGGISKLAARMFRELSKVAPKTNTCCIFINQIKHNPGIKFGNPEVTPGGSALRFYATLRLQLRPFKPSPNRTDAFIVDVEVKKNKCYRPPKERITFEFIDNKGPDAAIDVLNVGKKLGVLAFSGQALKCSINGDVTNLCSGGALGWTELVENDPTILQRVKDECIRIRHAGVVVVDYEEAVDIEEPELEV